MTSKHLGGLRLLTLPLAALLLLAIFATAARADYVSYADISSDNRYEYAEPGEVVNRRATLSLIPEASNPVRAGTTFTLQPLPVSGATVPPLTFTTRTPWPDSSSIRPTATVNVGLRAPDRLGEAFFNVSWATTGAPCAFTTTCLRMAGGSGPPIRYTINVTPRPVTNLNVDAGAGTAAAFSWTPSADDSQITRYYVWRYRKGTSADHREWYVGPGTSAVQDTGLEPGVEYCWNVAATYIDPTTGRGSTGWRDEYCKRTNSAPSAPGAPTGPEFDNDARYTINWDPAVDPENDAITYELERRDGDDAGWRPVAKGLTSPAADVAPPSDTPFDVGTWTYRVRAVGSNGVAGPWTEATRPVIVDQFVPRQPQVTIDPPTPASGWHRGPVTVTWQGSTDPDLGDGTPGSGIASYTEPRTFTEDGSYLAAGRAFDRAGNQSSPESRTIQIDTKPPTIDLDCPDRAIVKGTSSSVRWRSADDGGSGPTDAGVGAIELDTSRSGTFTVDTHVPEDRAGNVGKADTCEYTVHEPPTKPGDPSVPERDADGRFEVTWDPSTDPDGGEVTYELIAKDADSPYWYVPGGEQLSEPRYAAVDLPDGTWEWVVRATDKDGAQALMVGTVKTKVDRVAPSAPSATTEPAAPADDADGWFKDSVTVTFGGSTDPDLRDGSAGSGVASYTEIGPITQSRDVTGRAKDKAGNESGPTTIPLRVDAEEPRIETEGCPAGSLLEGTKRQVTWTARDADSGLTTAASGTITLDTSRPGNGQVAAIPAARDKVGHVTTAECRYDVHSNTPPGTPGEPEGPALDADGSFAVTWGAATDRDIDAGDSIAYEVEGKDANDEGWSPLADGVEGLRSAVEVSDGTWTFRVRAVDSFGAAGGWAESGPVKVDTKAPSAPTASTDPAAATDSGWFKDRVTVTFSGSEDPRLADGTAGSGVESYEGNATFTQTGSYSPTGFAVDEARHRSAGTEHPVKVDASAPTEKIACPTGTLIVGEPAKANWTAADEGAGLATPGSGEVALDTSSPGYKTAAPPPAVDRVGHQADGASCGYEVAYKFAGFSSPINGTAVNAGKTGRTYPVKWRLLRHDGSLIPDADAQALVASMSAAQRSTSCDAFGALPEDLLEESTTVDTALKYDAAADQFHYNYRAPATAGCYVLAIRNADGRATRQVNFSFTR